MSVKIRLRRMGKKKQPHYRIVVADSRSPRDGRFVENLGFYNPITHPAQLRVDLERVDYWLGEGAIASHTVGNLVTRARAGGDEKVALVGDGEQTAVVAEPVVDDGAAAEAEAGASEAAEAAAETEAGAEPVAEVESGEDDGSPEAAGEAEAADEAEVAAAAEAAAEAAGEAETAADAEAGEGASSDAGESVDDPADEPDDDGGSPEASADEDPEE